MRKLTYYVSATIDGFIAGPDGQYDFLSFEGDVRDLILSEYPETMPAQARGPLGLTGVANKHFDTILMGRGTYEPGLKAGMTSPYPHLQQYVFSRTLTSADPQVRIVSGDPVELVRGLKQQEGMGIWLCGGGKLASQLLPEIDELIIKRNPIVIGSGIPLFNGPFHPTRFKLASTRPLDIGVVIVTYTRA